MTERPLVAKSDIAVWKDSRGSSPCDASSGVGWRSCGAVLAADPEARVSLDAGNERLEREPGQEN